ncbi:hypothetical protein [Streptomyces sp. NPDC002779]|uniref:hypothetical protein n=1 Tax=Streptomyces sp. NPDC002779 TaxID=3364664 RepID=UPI0036C64762
MADSTAAEWLVDTGHDGLLARAVVLATGRNQTPHLPDWPGATRCAGSYGAAAST